jgi:GPI mannosyltransferase 3
MSAPAAGKDAWLPVTPAGRLVLWGSMLFGFALKVAIVFTDDGINWPDEIYQSFEPAHRLVFGHGLVAWEFLEGARTWAVPGFVAVWLWVCKLVGADSPATYVHVVKLVFAVLSASAAWGTYRLVRSFGGRELEAAVASATWSLCALALYFSARAMSENLSAPLLVWGVALTLGDDSQRRERIIGASLLGLATLARLQSGVVCLVVVLISLAPKSVAELPLTPGSRKLNRVAVVLAMLGALSAFTLTEPRWATVFAVGAMGAAGAAWLSTGRWRALSWKPALEVLGVLTVWALIYGAWDAAAWHALPTAKAGGFFHSAVVYWRFNIVENRGAGWGTAPWSYFFTSLFRTMPGVSVALLISAVLCVRRGWKVLVIIAAFLALHLFVSHKELRFIVPIMPLACALIGLALSQWPEKFSRVGLVLVGVAVLVSAATHKRLTMGDVGSYPERADSSAWDDFGVVNRLMLAASRQGDLCGLRIDAAHLAWTGGSTYLHRNAPLYMPGYPPQRGVFNYVITRPGSGARVVAAEGGLELVSIGPSCNHDDQYTWRLP